jgi:hypothetical protein
MKELKLHAREAVDTYHLLPGEVKRSIAITLCKLAYYEGELNADLTELSEQSKAEGWVYVSTIKRALDGKLKP